MTRPHPLAGLVDTAMLGHLPQIRFLAGVALGSVLFDYVYWSLGFLRMGTTGTVAQAFGRGDRREVYLVLYRSLVLALGLAAMGAGLATAIAQYLMLAVGVVLFLSQGAPEKWSWSELYERRRIGELFRLNRDIFIRTLCLVSAFAIFTNFSAILVLALFFAAPRFFLGLLTSHQDLVALWSGDNHFLWGAMVLFMVARTVTLGLVYPGLLREYAAA